MKKGMVFVITGIFLFGLRAMAMAGVQPISQPLLSSMFPIKITQPGSYALMTNIKVPNANTTAIVILVDNVTIDLNGFTILGPTVCAGTQVTSCAPTGSGNGIDATGHNNIKVTNGTIRGMGSCGIFLGSNWVIQGVCLTSNGIHGINVDDGTVSGSTVNRNGAWGIVMNNNGNAIVSGNTVSGNRYVGIYIGNGTVSGNTVIGNLQGIAVNGSGTVSGNTVSSNQDGIDVGNGTVSGNTVIGTGNGGGGIVVNGNGTVSGNTVNNFGNGIMVNGGGTVSGNTSSSNTGNGLWLGANVGYFNNILFGNAITDVTGGYNLGANLCSGSPCP